MTNQELAARLGCDPSTLHYHAQLLLRSGFLERAEASADCDRGARASSARPVSRGPSTSAPSTPTPHSRCSTRSQAELTEARPRSVESSSRFVLHLDDSNRSAMVDRIQAILDEYLADDADRRAAGQPRLSGLFVLHRPATPE
ncbi:MAG: hypothetical protein R2715_06145 [Ilumatobacteraceae bacterium]